MTMIFFDNEYDLTQPVKKYDDLLLATGETISWSQQADQIQSLLIKIPGQDNKEGVQIKVENIKGDMWQEITVPDLMRVQVGFGLKEEGYKEKTLLEYDTFVITSGKEEKGVEGDREKCNGSYEQILSNDSRIKIYENGTAVSIFAKKEDKKPFVHTHFDLSGGFYFYAADRLPVLILANGDIMQEKPVTTPTQAVVPG